MSVRVMARVWDISKHEKTELLVLLAIADFANDDGIAWPDFAHLGRKARCSRRHIRRIVKTLEESGELMVKRFRGRGRRPVYQVLVGTEEKGDMLDLFCPPKKGTPASAKRGHTGIYTTYTHQRTTKGQGALWKQVRECLAIRSPETKTEFGDALDELDDRARDAAESIGWAELERMHSENPGVAQGLFYRTLED